MNTASAADQESRVSLAAQVCRRLIASFGRHTPTGAQQPPLDSLIATILSQNTSDANSTRAFVSLKHAFPDWSSAADADVSEIESAIRCGGLAGVKAPRIRACLTSLRESHGRPTLDHLQDLSTSEARAELEAIPGVGPKTAACVLLFSLGRPVIPVDTHVHRVARRIGLAPPDADPVETEAALESAVAPNDRLDCHVNLIALGRTICRARSPRCAECPLANICVYRREADAGPKAKSAQLLSKPLLRNR